MKQLILTLFLLNLQLLNAQTDSVANVISSDFERTYILDMVWHGRDSKKFSTDGYPSFLKIQNGIVTLFSKSRDERFAYNSPFLELNIQSTNKGFDIKFLGETNYKIPNRPSFEISESQDGEVLIYLYHTLRGGEGTYFKAHKATETEEQKLTDFLVSQ